jgi:hypothetical protein
VTLAFRNGGIAGRRSVDIRLRGAPGNPTAVGARITAALADGSSETAEVQAGSGYYSQSTPGCFFGYADGNPPVRIIVRWPSGAVTEHAFAAGAPVLAIAAP